jgi:hypothetical protein
MEALLDVSDNGQMSQKLTRRQLAKIPTELSKKEAAEILGVHYKTIDYWIKRRREDESFPVVLNPYPSKFGRGLVFPRREIVKILRDREEK